MSLTILTTYGKEPFFLGVSETSEAVIKKKKKIEENIKYYIDILFILKQIKYL
jgi:hypothetical protein